MTRAKRIPVLMYHRIGKAHNKWESRYCIAPDQFDRHMRRLEKNGMQACSIIDFFDWLKQKKELPEGSFLLSFDDGYLGVYEHAAPVLTKHKWPATVFLVSKLVGARDEWCRTQNPGGKTYPLLDRQHIATLQEMGFSFHSHTRLHPDLTTLSDDELTKELIGSLEDLEDLLHQKVSYLAYPYGRYDERVVVAAKKAGYLATFSTQPGFNRQDIDPYHIRRIDVFGTDTPAMLSRKVYFGSNDGSWKQSLRYYRGRLKHRIGL